MAVSLASISVLISGCGQEGGGQAAGETASVSAEIQTEVQTDQPAEASLPVSLELGNWEDVQACLTQNAGKVAVVDVWSTSCSPCIEELPHLGQLQRDNPEDVVCISLSLDYVGIKSKPPEYYRDRVESVLERCAVNVRNFLCTMEADEVLDEIDLSAPPAVYVYDGDGKLVQRFDASLLKEGSGDDEPFTYKADVIPLVAQLTAQLDQ